MREDIDFVLGRRIRHRRRLLGMSQQELGARCGVRFQQIQKYECAANRLSAAMLWRLCDALQVEAGYFFDNIDGGPPPPPRVTGAGASGDARG